jgi:hypothetical protein
MDTTAQPTIWEVPDDVWTIMEVILNEIYPPPSPRAIVVSLCAGYALALASACAPVAHGISCRSHVATTAPCTGTSSAGVNWESSNESGRCWPKPVTSWVASTGRGKRPIQPWARPAGGNLVGRHPTERGNKGYNGASS